MKLIYQYSPTISIKADEHQCLLSVKKRVNEHDRHAQKNYFPTLEICLEALYEHLLKSNLVNSPTEDLRELVDIVRSSQKDFLDRIANLKVNIRSENRGEAAQSS